MSDNPYLDILDADARRREMTTGQPADGGNPYLRMLEDGEAARRQRLRAAASQAVDTNPDEIARKRRVAQLLGLPPTGADAIDDELKREARIRSLDTATVDAPVTRRSLGDPAFAKLAHDEAEGLAALERRFGGPLGRAEPIRGPDASLSSVAPGIAQAFGQGLEGTRQGLRRAFGDLFGFDEMSADAGRRGATNELDRTLSTPQFETATARGAYSAGVSIVQQAPGLVAGVMSGGATLPLSFMGLMTTAQAYGKYRDRGATGGEAAIGAIGEGAAEVATEALPMSFLVKQFGRVGAGRFITGLLAREAPSEQIATFVQDAIDTAVANPDKTWAQFLEERPGAAYETLVATIVQGGVMGGASAVAGRLSRDQQQAEAADAYVQRMIEVMAMAAESKLRERAPDSFKAFVDQAAEEQGGALSDVWVDGRALAEALNQGGITEAERIASMLPSAVGQMAEAIELGADVRIPVGEFAASIAGTSLEGPLMEHIKADPSALSAAQAKEAGAQAEATLRAEVERAVGAQAQTEQWRTEAQSVYDEVLGQIAATKRFGDDVNGIYATLVRDFYAVTAARTGMTPRAMFEAYPLRVQATAPAGMSLDQPAYHGSPFKFERFSLDAIGTGEGAQAYGWGLYFAESRGVASSYRIPAGRTKYTIDGKNAIDAAYADRSLNVPVKYLQDWQGDVQAAIKSAVDDGRQDIADAIKGLADSGRLKAADPGQFYEVDIPDDAVANMIRWDAPLSQQPKVVQDAVEEAMRRGIYDADSIKAIREFDSIGKNLYNLLGDTFNDQREASEFFASQGVPGMVYLDAGSRADGEGTRNIVLWDQPTIDRMNETVRRDLLNQTRPQASPRAAFSPQNLTITLYQGADLSSFLHEMGHFQLEVLADLASQPGAPQQVVADMDALLRWFGVSDLQTWRNMTLDEQRPYHEKFAEGFEVYLFEGRAPNVELVGAFQRIRAWMLRVYESIKKGFGFTLTDEVRGVFDRLIATDEAIQTAAAMRSFEGLFKSPDEAKMTAEEWERYQSLAFEAHGEAMTELGRRSLANMKWMDGARSRALRAIQKAEAEKRHEVRIEVARAVMSEPVYRAMQFLRGPVEKAVPRTTTAAPNVLNVATDSLFVAIAKLGGLNRAALASRWGLKPEEAKGLQPVFGKPLARADGGLAIDLMGERLIEFGYLTPDENGLLDEKQFEDAFFSELSGTRQYSMAADYGFMAAPRTEEEESAETRVERDTQLARMADWQGGRLDLDAMKLRFGDAADAAWRKLGLGKHGMVRSDGLDPELVAEFFGFSSADHLVTDLLRAVPPRERIQAETDQRMMERYGDLVDPAQVALAVDQAVHNEARGRFVAMELQALQRATSVREGKVDVLAAQAKAYAQQALAALRIRDIRPGKYTAAEGKAARAAMAALKSGDSAQAAVEKRNQLLHHHTARAAADVLDEVEKGVAYLRKFDREGTRKGLDAGYVDQIDALLERFDLRAVSNKAADKRAGLQAWIESQREQGLEPSIPDALLDEAYRQPYRNLTVEEFRGLVDSVKQIEHLGRLKKRLLTARDQREYEAIRDEIAGSIEANAGSRQAETRTPSTWSGRMAALGRRFVAAHLKVSTLANVMDGGKDGGPVWEHIVRPANERGDMETSMRAAATERLTEILSPVFKLGRMGGSGTYFESIGRSLNREQRIAIALNTGNEGNFQRLLGGEGWTRAQVQPVLDSLTKAEWIAVQEVWDYLESFRPLIAAKERRVYGKEPDWVEAVPRAQRTADGGEIMLRGGYFAVKYDPAASIRAEEHSDAEDAKRQLQGAYTTATTRRSFTKARVKEVKGRPLLYSLAGVYSGVNDVIHDLAWHEWLIDVNRLMKSQTIDAAIREKYGPEAKQQFKAWVNDIAEGDKRAQNVGEEMLSRLRQGISAAGLGFNVMSAIIQITGFNQSIVRIGAGWVGRGVAKTIANPIATARDVNEKSEFMRNRARTRFRELNELRNQVEDQSGVMRAIQANSYFLMMRVQKMVDLPTWVGAYDKAIASGADESKAVGLADQAVIDAQGGGQTKDLSQIERGGPALKLFTVYYSFMNTTFSLAAQKAMTANTPAKRAKLAVDYLMLFTVPAVLGAAIKAGLTPGGEDDDDMEALARSLAAEQLSYLMGTMVGVRELGFLAKEVTGAEGARFGYEGPAGLRALTDIGKLTKQAAQGEFDDAFRKAAINVLGDLTGLPAAQMNRSITGTQALVEGETDNPAAVVLGYQR